MQSEPLILLPTTHEQSNPTFHVEASLAEAFLSFLGAKGLRAWEPPERLEKKGSDHRRIIEVQLEAGTSEDYLEQLLHEFLSQIA